MGTGSFPGEKCVRGVLLTTHPLLVPRSWKSRAIPYRPSGPHRACNGITLPFYITVWGGSTVGWGTALQAGTSRIRFPMASSEFFSNIILLAAPWPWGRLSLQNKFSDNLTTFMYWLTRNSGSSTSWSPQGLPRPVTGLICPLFL